MSRTVARPESTVGVRSRPAAIDVLQAGADRRVVLVCNEGYSSSLAARTLRDLGVVRATDLVGGFQRWRYGGGAGS